MIRRNWLLFFVLLGWLLVGCAGKNNSQNESSAIEIQDPWARPAMMMGSSDANGMDTSSNGAAYMTIVNKGGAADRLTGVEGDVAQSC